MRVLAADSGCSILDQESFNPTNILVSTCVLTEEPFTGTLGKESKIVDYTLRDMGVVVDELRMCSASPMLGRADCIHLDTTLGGIDVLDLTELYLDGRIMTREGRVVLKTIMNDLRKLALEIFERTGIRTYAIGDKSTPIRISELHASIDGMREASRRAVESAEDVLIGLPTKVSLKVERDAVVASSIDQPGLVVEEKASLPGVEISEIQNPKAREFLSYRISPRNGGR